MHKYNIALYIFLLSLLCITHGKQFEKSNDFDVLIFTQLWPMTACFIWKENSEKHSCLLPKRDEWTIHGIWPTKYNTKGPEFCNSSLPFNASALAPLQDELKENWIDIQNGSEPYTFWKHEWNKHGTCAVVIKALNNEYKYFQEGLKLHDTYNMINVLAKANVLPGQKYMIETMLTGIQKKTGELYVSEIRLCFDKALQLTDCDGIYHFPTNCNKFKEIIYPSNVPSNYHVIQL
ncbi:ribonuclease Oy isoform X2 [Nylanderia fulva]|uniref:ribonuclease Oy isoform X2 n=1 Tax=Nylanderia fulva TaxID=613905 RepID=UPI0010FAF87F|nr:ribonuclease Oy isoform X2 [Nylanderia fulva]